MAEVNHEKEVIDTLRKFNYVANWIGDKNHRKKNVLELSERLTSHLNSTMKHGKWRFSQEHKISIVNKDRIDIFGEAENTQIIIEIDTCRHDQVAYKFLSRLALSDISTNVIYISFLYPEGEAKHKPNSAIRTLGFCRKVTQQVNNYRNFCFIGCRLNNDGNVEIIE